MLEFFSMIPTNSCSNAEALKSFVEKIKNMWSSALIRLFKQNENFLFDEFLIQNSYSTLNQSESASEVLYSFGQIDVEIQEIADDKAKVSNQLENDFVEYDSDNDDDICDLIDEDRETIYPNVQQFIQQNNDINDKNSDPMNTLNIDISNNSVPIYSCAAHKINLAVRTSIENSIRRSNTDNLYNDSRASAFCPLKNTPSRRLRAHEHDFTTIQRLAYQPFKSPVDHAPAPTPATPAVTTVLSPTPAPVINVYPQGVVQLDADNRFRRLSLGRGRTLHRSAIDLRRPVPVLVQTQSVVASKFLAVNLEPCGLLIPMDKKE
ncbi:hypothetical protein BpHYR1_048276 [Brachionus plicatilis]|uniref:Uncharacterized protein n=1 Tax=Brachionus plicatilis TaxID=10195 RepID=A0A3M7QCE2_BRAPC|nr:hypothetical protein BpHYR1_048276 [Brachionus plicatilis]